MGNGYNVSDGKINQTIGDWIDVAVDLPPRDFEFEDGSVSIDVLTFDDEIFHCAYYNFDDRIWVTSQYLDNIEPTHWMYLPKPPIELSTDNS